MLTLATDTLQSCVLYRGRQVVGLQGSRGRCLTYDSQNPFDFDIKKPYELSAELEINLGSGNEDLSVSWACSVM